MLGSAEIDNMFSVLLFFQIITSSDLSFFIFHKLIQVVFPSLVLVEMINPGWVPLGNSSGPYFLFLRGDSQGLASFPFRLYLDPICDGVCQHFLISFSLASFQVFYPIF